MNTTSWEESSQWYDAIVGKSGHYYHHLILPKALEMLEIKEYKEIALLDVACGQGVLARTLPSTISYQGIDISSSLIKRAAALTKSKQAKFTIGNACEKLPFLEKSFTHAACILALQNFENPAQAILNVSKCLKDSGIFVIVLNHPCFRIPRQTHWGIDESKRLQFRRIDCYLSPLKIPIQTHPGKEKSETTFSFHFPLSTLSQWLKEAGFTIVALEEWMSDKKSTGKNAKMENRARKEFPLFLAIKAIKMNSI